jgi:hypothetical protein
MCYRFCGRVFREIQSWTPVDRITFEIDILEALFVVILL